MKLYEEIKKSFPAIEKLFTNEELAEFINSPVSDLHEHSFGVGLWIRNNLLRPEKNNLYRLFSENGVKNADDMSCILIQLFHYHISKKL